MASDRDSHGNTVWHPLRHKLQDVLITGQPNNWTISMSNGLREHISNGYENWQQSRSGYRIWFYYDHVSKNNQTKHLKYICAHQLTTTEVQSNKNACTNDGIMITRANNKITVNGLQKFTITENYINGIKQVHSVIMPSLSSFDVNSLPRLKSVVDFAYDTQRNRPWLLKSVNYPTGMKTTFLYNQEADKKNAKVSGLPTGINGALIPVVTEQITTYKQNTTPSKNVWYYYTGYGKQKMHNFTGYQSGGITIPGKDNLFDRSDNYTYSVAQDNGLTTTTTTYNKYHLPILIQQKDNAVENL